LRRKPVGLGPRLVAELHAQFAESTKLEQAITANLRGLGYGE
jgi:type I restriction enzyme M protein